MQLKDFVAQTLIQISEGVAEAQEKTSGGIGLVNPKVKKLFVNSQSGGTNLALGWTASGELINMVTFDVAVTATDGTGTKGGIGIVIGAVALGSQGNSETRNEAISRVQFKVPLALKGSSEASA
jgi:hypothetical protein